MINRRRALLAATTLILSVLALPGCFQPTDGTPEFTATLSDGVITFQAVNQVTSLSLDDWFATTDSQTFTLENTSDRRISFRNATTKVELTNHEFQSANGTDSDTTPRLTITSQPTADFLDPGSTDDLIVALNRGSTSYTVTDPALYIGTSGVATADLTIEVEDDQGNQADFVFEFYSEIC